MSPDPRTNTLLVAAPPEFLPMADQLKLLLDTKSEDERRTVEVIQLSEGSPALDIAEMINQSYNEGEQHKASVQEGYKPKQVTVIGDPIRNVLLVSGAPGAFEEVQQIAEALQGPPVDNYDRVIIPIHDIAPDDLERLLNQVLYPHEDRATDGKSGSARSRGTRNSRSSGPRVRNTRSGGSSQSTNSRGSSRRRQTPSAGSSRSSSRRDPSAGSSRSPSGGRSNRGSVRSRSSSPRSKASSSKSRATPSPSGQSSGGK
jgi:hypothetical protein